MTRGQYITELRKKKNYTQDDVADKLGLTRSAISKYEHDASEMNLEIMEQMAKIYEDELINIIYGNPDAYKNIENNIEKLHFEKHKFELDNLKLKRKLTKQISITIISIILTTLSFFVYYFINTYNSIKIYRVEPSNYNDVLFYYGELFLTNQDISLNIYGIETLDDQKIQKIEIYLNNNLIFTTVNSNNVLLTDNYKSQSYFNFKTITKDLDNMYLKIYTSSSEIITNLIFQKEYNNIKLLFNNKTDTKERNTTFNSNISLNNEKYRYYIVDDNTLVIVNDDKNEKWILSKSENILSYQGKDIENFQYDIASKKYIFGKQNDYKLELFYNIYEEYKKANKKDFK